MVAVIDTLQVCADCLILIANGDETGIDERDLKRVRSGVRALSMDGNYPVSNGEEFGFNWRACECCQGLAGDRFGISILGSN